MNYQPVFIIGAPRSGTNILRDCLSATNAIATWPCDEINYIWKYGNATYPSDQLKLEQQTSRIKSYIEKQFSKLAFKEHAGIVLEKTCANCLRVDYINAIFPDAKYIYIYRDSIDCTASAIKRWKSKFDFQYTLRKVRYVPYADLPYYFYKFIRNRLFKVFSHEKRLAYWGPYFDGMDISLKSDSVPIVAARQWTICNELALSSLAKINEEKVFSLTYKELVSSSHEKLQEIANFLELDSIESNPIFVFAKNNIHSGSLKKGYKGLAQNELSAIEEITSEVMGNLFENLNN